jgi:hypothetical protein
MLAVEASPWNNDYAIPYQTSFHPSMDAEINPWHKKWSFVYFHRSTNV